MRKEKTALLSITLSLLVLIVGCSKDSSDSIPEPATPTFNEVFGAPILGVSDSSVAVADFNGDGFLDVVVTGREPDPDQERISRVHINDGTGLFSLVIESPLEGVSDGSVAVADVDNDGDQDILITGVTNNSFVISRLYKNDGAGNFTQEFGTPFRPVYQSSIAFSDVDNDGDQDVLITGWSPPNFIATLYINNGTGVFTEVQNTPFDGVRASSIAFADVDADNDEDVLITGINTNGVTIAKIYSNDGLGNFTEVQNTSFDPVYFSDVKFADVDGDNDQDVLITGLIDDPGVDTRTLSKLYINNGQGVFEENTDVSFEGVYNGSSAFADMDGDSDLDLFITGANPENTNSIVVGKVFTNNGGGSFMEDSNSSLEPVISGSVAFADFDNDGDLDVIITGFSSEGPTTKFYFYY